MGGAATALCDIDLRFPALILAAGRSRRMGFPKVLLSRDGQPALKEMGSALTESSWDRIMVALSDKSLALKVLEAIPNAIILINDDPNRGMISTIRLGIEAIGLDAAGLLCWPVDHPMVPAEILVRIRKAASPKNVAVPVSGSRRGHPTWWGRRLWPLLQSSKADSGANQVLPYCSDCLTEIETDNEGILLNLNGRSTAEIYGFTESSP